MITIIIIIIIVIITVIITIYSYIAPYTASHVRVCTLLTTTLLHLSYHNIAIPKIRIFTNILRTTVITYNTNPLKSSLLRLIDQLNAGLSEHTNALSSSSSSSKMNSTSESKAMMVDGIRREISIDPAIMNTVYKSFSSFSSSRSQTSNRK